MKTYWNLLLPLLLFIGTSSTSSAITIPQNINGKTENICPSKNPILKSKTLQKILAKIEARIVENQQNIEEIKIAQKVNAGLRFGLLSVVAAFGIIGGIFALSGGGIVMALIVSLLSTLGLAQSNAALKALEQNPRLENQKRLLQNAHFGLALSMLGGLLILAIGSILLILVNGDF